MKADDLQIKFEEIKSEICNLYKKSSNKKELVVNANGEEVNDHDYVDNVEDVEPVPVVRIEKGQETKRKTKKVSFNENLNQTEVSFFI